MRKPFIRKAKAPVEKEGAKPEGQASAEQPELNGQEAVNASNPQNVETPEGKQVQENQPHHAHGESNADEKDKKVNKQLYFFEFEFALFFELI